MKIIPPKRHYGNNQIDEHFIEIFHLIQIHLTSKLSAITWNQLWNALNWGNFIVKQQVIFYECIRLHPELFR